MQRRKHFGLSFLGTALVAALVMMAFSAVAQAHEWLIDHNKVSEKFKEETPIKVSGSLSVLLVDFGGGMQPLVHCESVHGEGNLLTASTALAHLEYLGCTIEGATAVCEVEGESILALVKAKIIEHAGEHYVLFEPHGPEGEFGVFSIKALEPEQCAAIEAGLELEKIVVTGSTVALPKGDSLISNQTICKLFEATDQLLYNNHPACVDGEALVTTTSGDPVLVS